MLRSIILLAGLIIVASVPIAVQAEDAASDTAVHSHADAMMKLAPLKGQFTVTGKQNQADGSVVAYNPSAAEGRTMVNGVGLEMDIVMDAENARPIANRIAFSYDQYRSLYRVTVLDDSSGLLDVYEGQIEDGVLSVTNIRADTPYPAGDMWIYFKLEWDMTEPVLQFDVLASVDGGETFMPYMMTELTPKV